MDQRRKLTFVANLYGGVELKKCRKQGISGSLDVWITVLAPEFFVFKKTLGTGQL